MDAFLVKFDRILSQDLFQIGDHKVTVSGLLTFFVLLLATVLAGQIIEKVLIRRLFRRYHLGRGLDVAIGRIAKYVVICVGVLVSFQTVGVKMESVAVIFGFLSVGIGFGLQNLTSNFISGILLLAERPVKVGDRITVDGIVGDVVDIRMRATLVRTLEKVCIVVPNSKFIEQNVTNWSYDDESMRLRVDVGVAYGSDTKLVQETILAVAKDHAGVLDEPEPVVLFMNFGDSSLAFSLFCHTGDLRKRWSIESDLRFAIDAAFREKGIAIPFPQRDVHLKTLPPGAREVAESVSPTT